MSCHILLVPLGISISLSTVPVASKLDEIFCNSAQEIRRTNEGIDDIDQANEKVRRRKIAWFSIGILFGIVVSGVGLYCGLYL